jgi:MSHA biogenesis protein MshO
MKGVTLIELVVVIVILGILAAITAVILVPTYEAYFAAQRRAELADVADAALRRMVRDVRLALPNSPRVRVDPTGQFLEILLTRNGGRYRALNDDDSPTPTTEDPLRFDAADDRFDTLGTLPTATDQQVQPNDYVVIHNLGISGANAYNVGAANPNIARILTFGAGAITGEDRITLTASTQFPLESPGRRFFVVAGPVTYACAAPGILAGNGTGSLLRWSDYPIQLLFDGVESAPKSLPAGGAQAILATNVSACEFTYSSNLTQLSRGVVTIRLAITRANETVVLYHQVHVNNVP